VEIDVARRELRASGVPVPIGGRAFEIIETLVKAAGQVVTKDDLMGQVWPGAIVEDNTLQVHISAIRKGRGACARLPRRSGSRRQLIVDVRGHSRLRGHAHLGLAEPGERKGQEDYFARKHEVETHGGRYSQDLMCIAGALLTFATTVTLHTADGNERSRHARDEMRSALWRFMTAIANRQAKGSR
jgi:hypothetical protein